MKRLLITLGIILAATTCTQAQQWLPGGQGVPIVCAYSSSPPTIASGGFIYAQCDTNGKLITSGGGGGGGGAVTVADGADVTQGSIGDSPWSGTGNGTLDAIMKAIYNAVISPPTPGSTTGGLTFVTKTGINGTPQQIGTTGAHQVYVEHCDNGTSALNTANTYLQYYDTATTPTFGTSVTFADPIAGSLTDGFALSLVGGQIANGIWITAATAPSGNTAPTNSLTCLFGYK